jgi:hypothetical protein
MSVGKYRVFLIPSEPSDVGDTALIPCSTFVVSVSVSEVCDKTVQRCALIGDIQISVYATRTA